MRSLYTVAALAAATKAQTTYRPSATSYNPYSSSSQYSAPSQYSASYPSNYGYSKPAYVAPVAKKPDHEHDNTMQHENPWDACQRDIAEADMDLMLIGEKCEPIGLASSATSGLVTSLMGLTSQMPPSQELTDQSDAIGQIVSTNVDQGFRSDFNTEIGGLEDELLDCKDIIQDSQLSLAMLQLMVDNLPSVADLEARLVELERLQGDTGADAMGLQQTTLATAIGVNLLEMGSTTTDLVTQQGLTAAWITTINGLGGDAQANFDAAAAFDTTLASLQATFDGMAITEDYFTTNALAIPFVSGVNTIADTTFCVSATEIMEFYLSGTIASEATGPGASIEAFKISLQDSTGSDVVAQVYTTNIADEFGRNFALYYKSDALMADQTYKVVVETDGAVAAVQIAPLELQWGYRTYGAMHVSGDNTDACKPVVP